MQLPQGNPKLPDEINNRDQRPLQDFLLLAAGVVLVLFLLSVLLLKSAQWLAPHIPYAWERDWFAGEHFDSALPTDEATDQTESDAGKDQALTELMERLLAGQPAALPVTMHWLDEEIPNAFATLGGNIFVTSGLLQQVSSENALAMVLTHEYAHVEFRHPITLVAEQLSLSTINLLLGNNTATSLTQQSGWLALLSYSRDMERAADQRALEILQAHYGHTDGAGEFFESMMKQREESRWQEMFQTHPLTQERLADIERHAHGTQTLTPLPAALVP